MYWANLNCPKGINVQRKIGLAVFSLLFLGIATSPSISADGIPDEQYVVPVAPDATSVGVQFLDSLFINMAGYLAADATSEKNPPQGYSTVQQGLCTSIDDATCRAGVNIYYLAHLPTCRDSLDLDCIVGMYAVKADGTRVDGVFQHGLPEVPSNPSEGNPALGIPRAGVDSVWKIPGVMNGGGTDTYLAISEQFGIVSKTSGTSLTQRIDPTTFSAGIIPVKELAGTYTPSNVDIGPSPNGTMRLRWYAPMGPNTETCAGVSRTTCAQREAFPADVSFGLTIRLSGEIKGWLHGRIRDPRIDYKYSSAGTVMNVQALPVKVPIVAAWTVRANLPALIPGAASGVDLQPGTAMLGSSSGEEMISLLKIWLPIVGDKAQADPTAWTFANLPYSNLPGASSCMFDSKSLAGFVSTNSTVYSAGPPVYNSETQSLDYKLASPHFNSIGEVFKGTYTLAIRSDVARCIYKFTNAPIKATISVTDDSGQSSVAAESMVEKSGWIYLSASNFTFSSPTVHVKLQGTPISTPTPTVAPTPSSTAQPVVPKSVVQKKITITCTKGSSSKKVVAVKPVCPKGFKKKAT